MIPKRGQHVVSVATDQTVSDGLTEDVLIGVGTAIVIIDNHDSGYLGMAVQLHVYAHLGHYHILTQKEYS